MGLLILCNYSAHYCWAVSQKHLERFKLTVLLPLSVAPAQSVQLATTISNLTGFGGSGNFVDTTRRMLGIDVLKFGESEIDTKATRVSVGKYVADGVYVEIQQGTSSGSHTSATVELEVLPNVTVEGGTTESGSNTVGLKWKWDY